MTAVMQTHISNVMGHFKGKCYAWDVVNEALEDNGTYRNNPFLKALGDSYFALSFKLAAAADPSAKLYYNDCMSPASPLPSATLFPCQNAAPLPACYQTTSSTSPSRLTAPFASSSWSKTLACPSTASGFRRT